MPDNDQTSPMMAGSDDATDDEKREGLREQVRHDHPEGHGDSRTNDFRERSEAIGIGRSLEHDVDAERDIDAASDGIPAGSDAASSGRSDTE